LEIIKKYESRLTFWISAKDKGQSDAINKGWKMSKGDILFYLNSDDMLHNPFVVEHIVKAYERDPKGSVFYGDCVIKDEFENIETIKKAKNTDTNKLLKERVFANILYQTASFFNAQYVREIGFLNENLHYCMDYELIVSLSTKGKMYRLDEPIAFFRVHSESKSHNGMIPMMEEQIKIKWKYKKWFAITYGFSYFKFKLFLMLPAVIQSVINPKLKKAIS
jgi:glycosyltransferase involved in cell wall biosynthesis